MSVPDADKYWNEGDGLTAILRAFADVLLLAVPLPTEVAKALRILQERIDSYADQRDVYPLARAVSEACETETKDQER